jgi:hypothetical protein
LERAGRDGGLRIRLRRIPAPTPAPSRIPPGFDAHQVRSDPNERNQARPNRQTQGPEQSAGGSELRTHFGVADLGSG